MTSPSEALAQYLSEVEAMSRLSRPERARLLPEARAGDDEAKKHLIESMLFDVARIAIGHARPAWMNDVDKIQEANIVLMRAIDDPGVEDVVSALKTRIPALLDEIAGRGPDPRT